MSDKPADPRRQTTVSHGESPPAPRAGPSREVDLTGRELGGYSLYRRLGRGGMAIVYLARQTSLNRHVALKILRPDLASDQSYVQRFQREARAAAALVQNNIVQIYEVGEADGFHFIAQEYVQGRNLKQYLARYGAVEPMMALNILRQCALALQKSAEFHVIHRDIKPENIMLSTRGEVKVTDFGLARVNNDREGQELTKIGITMGTPLYMSPEQVEGGAIDGRSDIYSLGVTAYHMLAGQPPFDGDNPLAIAVQQVKDQAAPLRGLRRDAPKELCDIIHAMIRKNPDQRPADASHLLKQLRTVELDDTTDWDKILERLAVAAPAVPADPQSSGRFRLDATRQLQAIMRGDTRRAKRRKTMLQVAGLSLLGAVAGAWLAMANPLPDPLGTVEVTTTDVPRKATVEQQYSAARWETYALGENDTAEKEKYWRAVIDYFPLDQADDEHRNTTELVHSRAQIKLAELYLSQGELSKAKEVFDDLANREERLSQFFRLMGVAGQAVVLDQLPEDAFEGGETERGAVVRRCLSQIGGRTERLNETMRERIELLFEKYPPDS